MRVLRSLAATLLLAALAVLAGGVPAHADARHVWPVTGPVVRGFDPPATHYGAGHRGIDIAAAEGTPVVAAADGIVTFAGVIDYVEMVTVTHGEVRTTYQPVAAIVHVGDQVEAGQPIGTLLSGHSATTSLHFGVLRGSEYLDPLAWLGVAPAVVRLLPDGTTVDRKSVV
jgi:murein DD-endopeptidase MepM/ murein hydrolase activator NlpD